MTRLKECISKAEDLGYRENFKVSPRGLVLEGKKYIYSPEETNIQNSYSFISDTESNNSILYLIETLDGKKGFLISDTGMSSDLRVSNFIKEVQQISKGTTVSSPFSWLTNLGYFFTK